MCSCCSCYPAAQVPKAERGGYRFWHRERTIGLSPTWAQFAAQQAPEYDYQATRYQIHNGPDCSGYIGWLIYNTFHSNNGEPGYGCKAANMASTLSSYGWGSYVYAGDSLDFQPSRCTDMRYPAVEWLCQPGDCPCRKYYEYLLSRLASEIPGLCRELFLSDLIL